MDERELRAWIDRVKDGTVSRRQFTRMMVGLGLTAPMAAQMLAASGVAHAQPKPAFTPTKRGGGGELKVLWWQAVSILNNHLAARLGMRPPAVSQVLKALTMRGWIERRRSALDQRTIQIHATAAGRQILRATAGRAVFTLQRAVCRLPQSQLEQLAGSVELLLTLLPDSTLPAADRQRARTRGRGPR